MYRLLASVAVVTLTHASTVSAAPVGPAMDAADPTVLAPVIVTGSREQAREVGGAATFLSEELLQTFSYSDVNRILRQAPGVVLQEEDGFGLRPNIGIRGSGTDRSARVALLEDGIPIAPAPYAAPSAYYFPRLARMTGVEIIKGPGAIKYGPMTTGGSINMFSTPIPGDRTGGLSGTVDLMAGDFGGLRGHAVLGGWVPSEGAWQFGGLAEHLHEESDGFKRLDSGGSTGFDIDDTVIKLAARTTSGAGRAQRLELKYQTYDERSDETYLGLTLQDFAADPFRRYAGSQQDVMNVTHETLQLTHSIDLTPNLNLTTVAYRNETARAWYKLNDVRNGSDTAWVGISAVLANPVTNAASMAIVRGQPGFVSADRGLRVRNNNRQYLAEGIQTVLTSRFSGGGLDHQLELSARYHEDSEGRFQRDDIYRMNNGLMELTTRGVDGAQTNRVSSAEAWAFFARDTVTAGRLTVTPGLRYETIDLTRANYPTSPPSRSAPLSVVESSVDVWLPGVGITWDVNPDLKLVAGAHRGFANAAPGSLVDPETSWNYEAGLRFDRGALSLEAIGFLNAYDNLLGTCTASTGGGCTIGDQFSGGGVEVKGLEVTAGWDAGHALGWSLSAPLSLVYTLSDGAFQSSFNSDYEPWGNVLSGDELPYLPRHQLALNAGLDAGTWRVNATVNHVSQARAVAGSGPVPAGQRVDARTLLDLAAEIELTPSTALFATVQNATDEVYNVGFAPAGARPGAPRLVMAGLRVAF
ncbi:TonB-dependent receptor [uncultured Brevundimonas sp.]|uniref:TonB-dependent receptor family protein n=1 Tax=uncultured Brevundimonas sp. TaxID=213418 RepID=UPI0030EF3078|tara:strand:+ start:5000 stop:7261 length:2262 start_codon:yes stop_codon:yes gene_type:complete